MSTPEHEPAVAGADGSTGDKSLRDIIEEVEIEHGHEGAAAMADALRDRTEETQQEDEDPAEEQD